MLEQARTNVQTVIASVGFLNETKKAIQAELQRAVDESEVLSHTAQLEEMDT